MDGIHTVERQIPMVKCGNPTVSDLMRNSFYTPEKDEMTREEIEAWFEECHNRLLTKLRDNLYPRSEDLCNMVSYRIKEFIWELFNEPSRQLSQVDS